MSLLNDALRRASESDRNRPRPAAPQTSLRSAAEPHSHSLALALVGGGVLALGLAGWFFWLLWSASRPSATAHLAPALVAAPNPAPAPVVRAENPPPTVAVSPPQVAAPIATTAPAPEPAKPIGDGWPVDLKVTGIFFRVANSQALISGRTVGVGDDIEGIQITKIAKDRVTVEWNGKVKELRVKDGGI
jgi:hypothetical protein